MLEETIKEKIIEVGENPSGLTFRLLSWVLTSIFFANIPNLTISSVYVLNHVIPA